MTALLSNIGFGVDISYDEMLVSVPTFRWDVVSAHTAEFEANIAEEVGRMYGFERIPKTVPKGEQAGHLSEYQKDRRLVRAVLLGAGCDETQPMPFLAPGDLAQVGMSEEAVVLSNPLDSSESVLRTSLMPGQLKSIAYNQSHRTADPQFFELGTVFLSPIENDRGEMLPDEHEYLAVALAGEEAPAAIAILNLLAAALALPNVQVRGSNDLPGMHPTRSAEVVIAGRSRGVVGEVAPSVLRNFDVAGRVAWLQLDMTEILNGPHGKRSYRPVSKFPSSDMDLAFVVADDVGADRVRNTINKAGGDLLVDLALVDTYRGAGLGDGTRSLAYRLRFQAPDRTLNDAEITSTRETIIAAVGKQTGGTLR